MDIDDLILVGKSKVYNEDGQTFIPKGVRVNIPVKKGSVLHWYLFIFKERKGIYIEIVDE